MPAMRRWRLWIGITISLVCLVLALAGIEWDQVGLALRRADWCYLVPAAASLLAYLLTRSIRWRILLGPEVSLAEA
ncbi:MAG: flippase-like domain-containing protein, partial [Chloroflexi bacterium]|nr:flippase-like domain-containing protein [Chloroflexota bacterium]